MIAHNKVVFNDERNLDLKGGLNSKDLEDINSTLRLDFSAPKDI